GLDHYWVGVMDGCAEPDEQEESLRWHARLAAELGKCLMIHNRESDDDLMRVLAEVAGPGSGVPSVMLHCFSSPLDVAREALDRGYVLSFTGNVTFKANEHLREAARLAPAGQLLVETDAPYMAPEPFRGARNEPGLVGYTARAVAEVRGQTAEELVTEVRETAREISGLADGPADRRPGGRDQLGQAGAISWAGRARPAGAGGARRAGPSAGPGTRRAV